MSLAPYDIELLEAWFEVVRKAHGMFFSLPTLPAFFYIPTLRKYSEPAQPPQLVVLLHEFEQFDPAVIQDLFYICRRVIIYSPFPLYRC